MLILVCASCLYARTGSRLDTSPVQPFLSWLITGAVGPALFGLPVTLAATDLVGAASQWFRRLRRSDGLSRIVRAAAGDLDLSRAEFDAVRRLLEEDGSWVQVGRDSVEELAVLVASRLSARPGEDSLAAARAIVGGLLEFAVRDLEPEWFQRVLFARLDRLQADQASALDQVMLSVHADLVALLAAQDAASSERFAGVMSELGRMLDRLPPGPADPAKVAVYLTMLIKWLNIDPWPQDTRFAGPALTPSTIERKLRITEGIGQGGRALDADDLAMRCARLVVLAGPGSGKTWLAKRAARLCAEAAVVKLATGAALDEIELPLYTTCARLSATPPGDGIRRAVVASALGHLPDLGGARVTDAVQMLFENRDAPTLLVVDSLDEAHGADGRVRQADTLPPSWRIMLTSRMASWNRQLDIPIGNPSRRVGALEPIYYPDDVDPFIAGWFVERPDWAADLVLQLLTRPDLQQAATVPLILAFYCIVGGDQPLPSRRADLYTKVIRRMLLGRWRGNADHEPDPDVEACLEILRDWAWSAAASNPLSGVGAWEDEFFTPRVTRSRDDREALDHVASPLGPPDPDTGMTRRRFVHRSIREHLVAEYLALRMPAGETAEELLKHLWYDPDWEYAAPAALAMHRQRDQILNDLLSRVTGGDQLPTDLAAIDGSWEVRRFLARLAQESGEDDWLPQAAGMIGQARMELAMSQQDNLREVVTSGWPTSNANILQSLLDLFPGQAGSPLELLSEGDDFALELFPAGADLGRALMLANAVTQLAMTVDERARAREVLLGLLASQTDPAKAQGAADAVARLDPTPEQRAQAKEAVLGLLAGQANPGTTLVLAEAVAQLDPTAEERMRAQQPLLAILADDPDGTPALMETIERLAVTPVERARAEETLIGLLASETGDWAAEKRAGALIRLAVTAPERAEVRERLLALLTAETDPKKALVLAQAVAGLDPTAGERARARQPLLALLGNHTNSEWYHEMAGTLDQLNPTPEERAQARQRVLALLAIETDPEKALELGQAVAGLDPTAGERTQTRQTLVALLPTLANAWTAEQLAEAVARLTVTAEERARARRPLLALLTNESDPRRALVLAVAVARLGPTPEELARARQPLLALLTDETDCARARTLGTAITRLAVAAGERAEAREVLLTLLASETDPGWALDLVEAVARLDPTMEERARARQSLLALLASETSPGWARDLVEAVTGLDPTVEEQARARQSLLTLLASETDPGWARDWIDTIAQLSPTIADLDSSGSWVSPPTPALLAAARQNSRLSTWLAALPAVSGLLGS
jgi:hypothetical protein